MAGAIWRVAANTSAIETLNPDAIKDARDQALVEIDEAKTAALGSVAELHRKANAIPVGGIVPFFGNPAALPPNWRICDGSVLDDPESPLVVWWRSRESEGAFQVPDLRGRFVMGVPPNEEIGDVGGRKSVPRHRHSSGRFVAETADHTTYRRPKTAPLGGNVVSGHTHQNRLDVSGWSGWEDEGDNRPPFVSLHYIIKIK